MWRILSNYAIYMLFSFVQFPIEVAACQMCILLIYPNNSKFLSLYFQIIRQNITGMALVITRHPKQQFETLPSTYFNEETLPV